MQIVKVFNINFNEEEYKSWDEDSQVENDMYVNPLEIVLQMKDDNEVNYKVIEHYLNTHFGVVRAFDVKDGKGNEHTHIC